LTDDYKRSSFAGLNKTGILAMRRHIPLKKKCCSVQEKGDQREATEKCRATKGIFSTLGQGGKRTLASVLSQVKERLDEEGQKVKRETSKKRERT